MKRSKIMKLRIKPIVAACALAMAAGQAGAIDYTLATKAYSKTMSDGSIVPMWGYVIDPDNDSSGRGDCYETTPAAARRTCVDNLPDPVAPGPRLDIPPTDTALRIFLTNTLPEPTSIVIPGQELPYSAADNGPTWDGPFGGNAITGGRPVGDTTLKMRSYGREANRNGGRRAYVWNSNRNNPITNTGSFIYHTGTHPQKQLYMGLYGMVTRDSVAGEVYPGVAYTSDTTLFYSDIDPDFNKSVVAPYDPAYAAYPPLETAIERHPTWFLINGEPYDPVGTINSMGTQTITGIDVNQNNLIRFASAATEKHVPVFQGLYGTIHGEDGMQYMWQAGVSGAAAAETAAPIEQYSIGLPPLKTKDVIVTPALQGTYSIYDGNGYMTNPTANEATGAEDTVGGMLRKLGVAPGTNQAPVAVADQFTVEYPELLSSDTEATPVAFLLDVIANDSDINNDPLTLASTLTPNQQYGDVAITIDAFCNAGDTSCSVEYGYTGPAGGTETFHATPATIASTNFDYDVTDGSLTSGLATVTLDYLRNEAPTAADHALVTDAATDLLFNALDGAVNNEPGDVLNFSYSPPFDPVTDLDPATQGALVCAANGECTFTPPTDGVPGPDSVVVTFDYVVLDDINTVGNQTGVAAYDDKITGTVTITVDPVSTEAPQVIDDNYMAIVDTDLVVDIVDGVLSNDTEPQGQPMTAAFDGPTPPDTTTEGGTVVLNADGSFTYTPPAGFSGADTFTYIASDDSAPTPNESLPATVTITVGNVAPVAVADSYSMTESSIFNEAAPGVLVNDTDADGQALTASLVAGSGPSCGSLTLNSDGSFTYEPQIGWNSTLTGVCDPGTVDGSDTFSYVANDGLVDSAAVSVNITVNPQTAATAINDTFVLDAPTVTELTAENGELVSTTYVTASALDNDLGTGTNPTATEVNDPDNLSPEIAASGEVTLVIEDMAMGTIGTLEYQFTNDGGNTSNIAQVSLVRYLGVKKSEFNLREDGGLAGNPDNDDWRITGNVDPTVIPPGSSIFAYIIRQGVTDPIPINTPADINPNNDMGTVFNVDNWRIHIDNVGSTGPRGDIDQANDRLRIEAHVDDGNGGTIIYTYDNVPIHVQP
ncbi:MAG: Ig-like domain-containing protein [Candidatus Thiodiazotropha endolucinida]